MFFRCESLLILCFVSVEEKADPSIPLYVLPLYSLLAPEKQAKVRLISYVRTKLQFKKKPKQIHIISDLHISGDDKNCLLKIC